MNCRRKFREIRSWRTCTWPAQTTKMCRTQNSCKYSYTLSQGLSRSFVRIFVSQNLSTEPFFSNMTATKQQQRKYDTCTPHSCRYYKQIADRNSCFGGTKLYLGQCNLGGTHKSKSPDSGDFPDMRIYFANSVNGSLNLSLQIGNCQR